MRARLAWPSLKSLQARLLALLLLMVMLVWAGAALLTWADARDELGDLLDGHLAQSAALLVVQQAGRAHPDWADAAEDSGLRRDAPSLHKYAPSVAFQVFHEGRLTLRSDNAGAEPMSPRNRGFTTVRWPDGSEWRVFATRATEGDVQVYVAEQLDSRRAILWGVLRGMLMPMMLALPLLAVVGWLAVRNGLAPLRRLSQAVARRRPQALEPVRLPDLPTEVAPVVRSLNDLFERIEQMMVAERRFTADAAHELRTPIAAIRAQAQVALGAGGDAAAREHALRVTLQGCDRATHLVEQLLTLSRLEDGSSVPTLAPVDLAALTQSVAAELALAALGRGQEFALDADGAARIDANEALARVLVRNLLDNALRYSPDGARVQVTLRHEAGAVLLQVDDSGPGLQAAEMERLGERFYRVLGSGQTGSGLGWSIVRRIAAVHAAQIEVRRSQLLGGLCVRVRWPMAAAPAPTEVASGPP